MNLSFIPSETYDVVLCMGPLYHLIQGDDRIMVIQECKRVVKKTV